MVNVIETKKDYRWKTPKGADVSITVTKKHTFKKTVNADGVLVDVRADEWSYFIDRCVVNGKPTKMKEFSFDRKSIIIDRVRRDYIMALLPDNVREDIFGEEEKDKREKSKRSEENEKRYLEHREKMRKIMGY